MNRYDKIRSFETPRRSQRLRRTGAKWVKEQGFTVLDIGNPNNKGYSHFYNGECLNIFGK